MQLSTQQPEAATSRMLEDLGKVYWAMGGLTNHARPTWMEDLAAADMSWIFDATGLI